MEQTLRIIVADTDPGVCQFYEKSLSALGHVVGIAPTGPQLIEQCNLQRPDLLITETNLPELDGLTAAREVCRQAPVPVIVVFGHQDAESVARALDNPHVLAYLIKPLQESELAIAIALAVRRFRQMRACEEKAASLRQALEDRKLVERAKGVVAKYCALGEHAAHHCLKKLASAQNVRLVEAARAVLNAGEVFQQLEKLHRGEHHPNGRSRNGRNSDEIHGPVKPMAAKRVFARSSNGTSQKVELRE
jgi:response regulator NasT